MKKLVAIIQLFFFVCVFTFSSFSIGSELASKTYKVMAGDTLDKVIHKTMPDSPLKIEVLRDALISQNENAFIKNSPNYLIAGATIRLPNQDDLMSKYMSKEYKLKSLGATNSDSNERKNWIRFP